MTTPQPARVRQLICLENIGKVLEPHFTRIYHFSKTYPTAYKIFVRSVPFCLSVVLNILGTIKAVFIPFSILTTLVAYFLIYADAKGQIYDNETTIKIEHDKCRQQEQLVMSNTVRHTHFFMHHLRDLMSTTVYTAEGDYRYLDFFGYVVRGVEETLTSFYNKPISVSIKIVTTKKQRQKEIATIKRGPNNIASRNSINEIDMNDPKTYKHPTNVNENYAYTSIIKNCNRNFVCGDLSEFNKGKKKFRCEYTNWNKIFNATIIIPIRGLVNDSKDAKKPPHYLTRGLICVDSPHSINNWNCCNENEMDSLYAYNFCATVADMLYPVISKWVDELEETQNANA